MFFEFDMEKTAHTLEHMSNVFECSLREAWNEYMHPAITSQTTYDEVINYINNR